MKLLVAYASAHGSTAEIAEFIGKELGKREFDVTVQDTAEVQSLEGYDALVLGSAIQAGMWLTEMSQFLDRFQPVLAVKPIFFFVTCIRVLEPDGYKHVMQEYLYHQVLDKMNIKAVTAFAGRLELDAVDWDERWTLAARYDGANPPGTYNRDFRDWNKIRAWSQHIADILLPAEQVSRLIEGTGQIKASGRCFPALPGQ